MRKHILLVAFLALFLGQNAFAQPDQCIDQSLIDPFFPCFLIYDPVCGCDGNTYSNDCVALNNFGVTEWTPGECPSTTICADLTGIDFGVCAMSLGFGFVDGSCTEISGCGYIVDNVNYVGNFFATEDGCVAACGTGCIDEDQIDLNVFCLEIYDPVCGCDGVTYSNECVAFNHYGVTEWVPGECNIETVDECEDVAGVDFGPCDFELGYALVNGTCQSVSGCDYVIDLVDYNNAFYDDIADCQDNCMECSDPEMIDLNVACDAEYDPVCGCDGVTYSNACVAQYWNGVTYWTTGACSDDYECLELSDVDFGDCEMAMGYGVVDGVCASVSGCGPVVDGVDYSINLFPTMEGCQTSCAEIVCIDENAIDENFFCEDTWAPVCGCDSVTYPNSCVAYNHYGVTSWDDGPCSEVNECYNPDFDIDDYGCYEIYDPVCGCDSITYSNDCFAFYAGVQSWVPGECVTAVSNIDVAFVIQMYPNPFEDNITLEIQEGRMERILVLNAIGQTILDQQLSDNTLTLETSNWAKGTYHIQVTNQAGLIEHQVMIKD